MSKCIFYDVTSFYPNIIQHSFAIHQTILASSNGHQHLYNPLYLGTLPLLGTEILLYSFMVFLKKTCKFHARFISSFLIITSTTVYFSLCTGFWMELVDSLENEIIDIVDDFINIRQNIHFRIVVSGTRDSCGITIKLKLYKCHSCTKPVIVSKVFIACSGDVLHFAAYLDGIVHLFNTHLDSSTDSDSPIME